MRVQDISCAKCRVNKAKRAHLLVENSSTLWWARRLCPPYIKFQKPEFSFARTIYVRTAIKNLAASDRILYRILFSLNAKQIHLE